MSNDDLYVRIHFDDEDSGQLQQNLRRLIDLSSTEDVQTIKAFDQSTNLIIGHLDIKKMHKFIVEHREDFKKLWDEYLSASSFLLKSQFLKIAMILSIVTSFNSQINPIESQQHTQSQIDINKTQNIFESDNIDASFINLDSNSDINSFSTLSSDSLLEDLVPQDEQFPYSASETAFLRDPKKILLHQRIIKALSSTQYSQQTLILYKFIRQMSPQDISNRIALGKNYMTLKLYKEALKQFEYTRQHNQKFYWINYYIGICYKQLKVFTKAVFHITKAIQQLNNEKDPYTFKCLFQLGTMSLNTFKSFQAILYFKKCFQINPLSFRTQYMYAYALFKAKEYHYTLVFLKEINISWKKIDTTESRIMGNFYAMAGNIYLQIGKSLEEVHEYYFLAARQYNKYQSLKRDQKGSLLSTDWLGDDNPLTCFIYLEKGKSYYKHKKYKQAKEELLQYLAFPIKVKTEAYIYLGRIYFIEKEKNELAHCLFQLIKTYKKMGNHYYYDQLRELLIDIRESNILQQLKNEYNNLIKKSQDIQMYNSSIIDDITQLIKVLNYLFCIKRKFIMKSGQQLYQKKIYEYAIKTFQMAKDIDPKNDDAYIGLGQCYLKLNQRQKAKQNFIQAKRCMESLSVLKYLTQIYQSQQNNKKLQKYYKAIIKFSPQQHIYGRKLSQLYCLHLNNIQKGTDLMIKSLDHISPDQRCFKVVKHIYKQGMVYAHQILQKIQDNFRIAPQTVNQISLLDLYMELKLYQKAKEILFIDSLSENDKEKYCLIFLRVLNESYSKNQQLQKDTNILKLAEQYTNNASIVFELACLLQRYQQFEKAINYFEKTVHVFQNKTALKRLIQCYRHIGQFEKVKQCILSEILSRQEYINVWGSQSSSSESQSGGTQQYNDNLKRLCELYKLANMKQKHYEILEKVVKLKPFTPDYMKDMIELQLQFQFKQRALYNIKKLIQADLSNEFAIKQLGKLFQKDYLQQNKFQHPLSKKQVADKIVEIYLADIKQNKQFICTLFYFFFGQFDDSLKQFAKAIEKLTKKQDSKKTKQQEKVKLMTMVRTLKNVQTKEKYKQKSQYLIILRGILHHLNGKANQARDCFLQVVQKEQRNNHSSIPYYEWFVIFLQKISQLSNFSQTILLQFVLMYMLKEQLGQGNSCVNLLISNHPQINFDMKFQRFVTASNSNQLNQIQH